MSNPFQVYNCDKNGFPFQTKGAGKVIRNISSYPSIDHKQREVRML